MTSVSVSSTASASRSTSTIRFSASTISKSNNPSKDEVRSLSAGIISDLVRASESDGAYEDDVKAGFTFSCTLQCTQTSF